MQINEFLAHFESVKQVGPNQWQARCPAHDDRVSSLSITANEHGIALFCHAGCKTPDVIRAAGLTMSDLFFEDRPRKSRIVATYDYTDESGKLLFQVVRKDPKAFVQRKPDGKGGWVYRLGDTRRVLYKLPELLNADPSEPIFIVEGEKDTTRLYDLGLVATTNPGGAGKWKSSYNHYFRDRDVAILPDADEPGREHARQVAESLQGVARSIVTVELPGLGPKQDASDWLKDHTKEELLALVERARMYTTTGTPGDVTTSSTNALETARETVAKWLELPDLNVVDLILSTVVANAHPGDPVWLLLVGAPSSAKSELLRGLGDAPQVYRISSLTGKTLLSGHKDAGGGLLFRIKNGSTLLLLDFGQVLSLHPNDKALVLQRLREIYDGYSKADFGNRTDGLEWKGKLGFLAGVTPAVEKFTSVGAELGDRFLLYTLDVPDPNAQARGAMLRSGQESTMREEIAEAFLGVLQTSPAPGNVTVPESALDALTNMAVLATRLRSVVSRNRYTRAIDYIPKPEGPARFAKALITLGKALAAIRGKDEVGQEELAVLAKVALDCIPSRRRKVAGVLAESDGGTTKAIGLRADIATASVGLILEDLMYLSGVERWVESNSETAPFHWRMKPEVLKQWALAQNIAQGQELLTQKQTREIREILKEDMPSLVFAHEAVGVSVYSQPGNDEQDLAPF